jgi:uncharacterized membrane protein
MEETGGNMKRKHKIIFFIAFILAVISWMTAADYWDKVPAVIPVHFGISGQPNSWADKSLFYVFLIPSLQTLFLAAFAFLYHRPQYSNIPTTMWLMALGKKQRDNAFDLIRTMLTGTTLFIGVLFTYITYEMNVSALDSKLGLSPWVMLTLIGLMIIWLAYWTVKVYKATKKAVSKNKRKRGGKK